jgi:hypothetical protein
MPDGSTRDNVHTATDRSLAAIELQIAKTTDILKQQLSFYDRLLLLAGATITLTFTATASFHSHSPKAVASVASLEAAWIFLVYAMLACLASNWCTIVYLSHQTVITSNVMLGARNALLQMVARDHNPAVELVSTDTAVEAAKRSEPNVLAAKKMEKLSRHLGRSAQIAIMVAYVTLLFFLLRNVQNI